MKRFLALICFICFLTSCIFKDNQKNSVSGSCFYMDTLWNIKVSDDSGKSYDEICNALKEMDKAFNCHFENGEAFLLNENGSGECSDYLKNLVSQSLGLSEKYSDRVSILCGSLTKLWEDAETLPGENKIESELKKADIKNILIDDNKITLLNGCRIDTGAFAKGYALDELKKILDSNNSEYALISAVSSILLYGEKPDGEPFSIQIKGQDSNEILGTAFTDRDFVSTSGSYERYFTIDGKQYNHIIDMETGMSSDSEFISVTVFCDSGILSDYLSTLIFSEGTENIEYHLNSKDYEVAAFDKTGKSYISERLDFSYEK